MGILRDMYRKVEYLDKLPLRKAIARRGVKMGVRLPDTRFLATVRIMNDGRDNTEMQQEGEHLLREIMADKLVKAKMEAIYKPHHTELRMELYVMTPDEMSKLVHSLAKDLARRI